MDVVDDTRDLDAIYSKAKDIITESVGRAKFTGRYYNRTSVGYQKIVTEVTKKYKRMIDAKLLSPEKERELTIRCFVKAVFEGVENAFVDVRWAGQDRPYDFEAAVALFMRADELYVDLAQRFSDRESFQNDVDGTVKN